MKAPDKGAQLCGALSQVKRHQSKRFEDTLVYSWIPSPSSPCKSLVTLLEVLWASKITWFGVAVADG